MSLAITHRFGLKTSPKAETNDEEGRSGNESRLSATYIPLGLNSVRNEVDRNLRFFCCAQAKPDELTKLMSFLADSVNIDTFANRNSLKRIESLNRKVELLF